MRLTSYEGLIVDEDISCHVATVFGTDITHKEYMESLFLAAPNMLDLMKEFLEDKITVEDIRSKAAYIIESVEKPLIKAAILDTNSYTDFLYRKIHS